MIIEYLSKPRYNKDLGQVLIFAEKQKFVKRLALNR